MLQHNDSRNPCDQESTERSMPSIPQKAEDGRDAETDQDRDPLDVSILPANELVFLQVGYVVVRLIGLQLEKQPTDMREKEPFRNTVRIIVMIHMLMMTPMFARPHQNRVFKGSGAKNKCEQPDRPACLEGNVREKPMITYRDAKSASGKHRKEEYDLKPIKPEKPEIERDGGQCESQRANEKGTG
jgi:hypothetical protein